jgi:hypothetical protein
VQLDLRDGLTGELGERGAFVSDLVAAAERARFTGHVHLAAPGGEAHVYLRGGALAHVSGSAVLHDFVGELLVAEGLVEAALVDELYARQSQETSARRVLGELVRQATGLDATTIARLVAVQVDRRARHLFALTTGHYMVEARIAPDVAAIAVDVSGLAVLAQGLRAHASDLELQLASDELLGHAVSLREGTRLSSALALTPDEQTVLGYLDKPRKVHHLEAVAPRSTVRALLKLLAALDLLSLRPASEGLAIAKAVRLPKNSLSGLSSLEPRMPNPPPEASPPGRSSSGVSPPASGLASLGAPPEAGARSAVGSPSGPPVAAALIRELEGVRERIGKVSFYDLLGVKPDASAQVVRTAYTQLAKKYHPDSLGGGGGEATVNLAREASAALNEAYTALSDNERRKKYDDLLRAGNVRGDEAQAGRLSSAKLKFEMGSVFLKKRDYKKARETLRFAVELAPESGLFRGTLAWAYLADPGHDRRDALEKAEKLLLEAVKQAPREAHLHYYLGRFYKERGELGLAETAFKRALLLDSKLHEAESELRVLERRREKDGKPEKASPLQALAKLFKR